VVEIVRKKWASIYANEKLICVETCSGLRMTARDPDGKFILLSIGASPEGIGDGVKDALSASRVLSPAELGLFFDVSAVKQRYEEWVSLLLKEFDYESRRALFKEMKHCQVECVEGVITIMPTHHEKIEAWSGKGLDESSYVMVPENASSNEVGEAVLLAISRCTGK